MISMYEVVRIALFIMGAAAIFALLFWLPVYIAQKWPWFAPAVPFIHVVLAVLGVLVIIGIILSLISSTPLFRP